MPCPIKWRPSRIERGSGVRFSQPKRAAPSVRHWRMARVENGRPLNGSIAVSFSSLSATGSTPVLYASSSIALSSAKCPSASCGERMAVGVLRLTWTILWLVAMPPLAAHSERVESAAYSM
jgi:hypothetical protein